MLFRLSFGKLNTIHMQTKFSHTYTRPIQIIFTVERYHSYSRQHTEIVIFFLFLCLPLRMHLPFSILIMKNPKRKKKEMCTHVQHTFKSKSNSTIIDVVLSFRILFTGKYSIIIFALREKISFLFHILFKWDYFYKRIFN